MFRFIDHELSRFARAGGDALWEFGQACDFVESGVFGPKPVVWPGEEAGGGEGGGGEERVGV